MDQIIKYLNVVEIWWWWAPFLVKETKYSKEAENNKRV